MMMQPEQLEEIEVPRPRNSVIAITDTVWGYIMGPVGKARRRANTGEAIAAFGAAVFAGLALAQWFFPGSNANPELVPFKIGISSVFFLISGVLFLMSRKGLSYEAQIDMHELSVRIVRRNRKGGSVTLENYDFDTVRKIFVKRAKGLFMYDQIFLDTPDSQSPVVLATGPQVELEKYSMRLMDDIYPIAGVEPRRIPTPVPFFKYRNPKRKPALRRRKTVFG